MTKTVELYVRSAQDPKTAHPLATTYLGEKNKAYSTEFLSCPCCEHFIADLGSIRQPAGGWPDVLFLICDLGFHRVDEP
jgi:hypothetical protein